VRLRARKSAEVSARGVAHICRCEIEFRWNQSPACRARSSEMKDTNQVPQREKVIFARKRRVSRVLECLSMFSRR